MSDFSPPADPDYEVRQLRRMMLEELIRAQSYDLKNVPQLISDANKLVKFITEGLEPNQ